MIQVGGFQERFSFFSAARDARSTGRLARMSPNRSLPSREADWALNTGEKENVD